jgi:hypothetical protein
MEVTMAGEPLADWQRFVAEANAATAGFTPGPASPQPVSFAAPHIAPSFDIIERVPEERKDRFRKVCQHADDACALAIPFEDIRLASMDCVEKENAVRRLTSPAQDGGFNLPETDNRVVLAQQALTKAKENFRRVQKLQTVRAVAQQAALRVKANCEDFLRFAVPGDCRLEAIEVEPPRLNKGENLIDAIFRCQRRNRELRADLARVEAAAYPVADASAVAMPQIDALYERGALDTSGCVEHLGPIRFPTKMVQALVHNSTPGAVVFVEMIDTEAVIAHLLRPQLIAAVEASIAADADEPNALGQAEREKRAAVISQDMLSCEREEASLTWRAQAEGLPIEFRSDISPLALLGLKLITAPRADALPETSPMYSWPMKR